MNQNSNESLLERLDNELPDSTAYWMLIAIGLAQAWTVYVTFYHSRVLGIIITAIINKFVKYGHIQMGSFSFSVLSGKVMFRDVYFITEDFSVRAEYGWLIFRWWRPYVYKELTEDMSHMETRMSVFLDGFEFHVYNKSTVYRKLDKLFRGSEDEELEKPLSETTTAKQSGRFQGVHWRDLIPVIKFEISSGRWIFGNYLLPYSALFKFDKANAVYTTKPASTVFDKFMHILKCEMENARLMLVPSPKYNGPVQDEPPRFMGEGFVVMLSNDLEFYYYQDEPGIVPLEPEQIQMADGEVLVKRTYPCVGVDIKCGKNSDFNYGPWVERQREVIWKFFYPADYQPLVPTKQADPGELRQFKTMEIKMTINAISTFDILFTKNSVTQALHMNAGKGSYVEVTVPYIVEETGYLTKVKGQLMLVDATTSMPFRSLVECETFEFDVTAYYPRDWNACQEWRCDLTACKAVVYLIYDLKTFFSDLVDDWSSKAAPDIYSFVPYNFTLSLVIKQFELLTLANENNWVDTSSQHQENAHIAFCGELFDLCVTFPFNDFLPKTLPINLMIKGETVFCRLYLPESNTMKHALIAISENMKIVDREGNEMDTPFGGGGKQWRKVTLKSNGWIDCWTTPYVFLTVVYTYYPMPVLLSQSPTERVAHLSLSSPILEEELGGDELAFLDIPSNLLPRGSNSRTGSGSSNCDERSRSKSGDRAATSSAASCDRFDPGLMEPDVIQVELEVAPSVLVLYGSLLRNLIHLKENYLGEYQKATDFEENPGQTKDMETSYVHVDNPDCDEKPFDPRTYRPFSVTVSVTLHDIQAHLARNCAKDGLPCPSAHVERLCFEMDKTFKETKLQVLLSPCVLLAKDCLPRDAQQEHLRDGHLALSGLQLRGHAMFSLEGLPLDSETLEYGWLIEVIIGEVTGKLTTPQLQNIAEFLQTFIMMIENAENKLQTSLPFKQCQHMLAQDSCPHHASDKFPFPCPTTEEVKYEMTRISVDFVSIFLVESGSALNVQVHPIRIANCNLHGPSTRAGITGLVDKLELKQYVGTSSRREVPSGAYTTGSQAGKLSLEKWLEAGGFSLGPIMLEAAMALPHPLLYQNQDKFLRLHDAKTKSLWFLWKDRDLSTPTPNAVAGKCGCLGGCVFFGTNKNGLTFFKVKRHSHGVQVVAVPQVSKDGADPGFGQSLLHAGKLVFETSQLALRMAPSPSKGIATMMDGHLDVMDGFAFTRGYMSELASPDVEVADCHPGVAGSPAEDGRPKSTFSDTQMLLAASGTRQVEVRHHSSRDVFLLRQSSLPTTERGASGVVLRPGSKKRKRSAPVPTLSPSELRGTDSISISVMSHNSAPQHGSLVSSDKLDTVSSVSQYYTSRDCKEAGGSSPQSPTSQDFPYSIASAAASGSSSIAPVGDLSRPTSNISIDSESYMTANEDTDTESGNATLTRDSTIVSGFSVGSDEESCPNTIKRAPLPTTSNTTATTSPSTQSREDSSSNKGRHRSRQHQQHRRKGSNRRLRQHIQQHLQHQTSRNYKTLAGSSASSSAAEDEEEESTLSFCSAPSENDFDLSGSDVDAEDLIDMINLHNHMNLPITESPLLLSCYSQHLSHYYCQDWCSSAPQLAVYASRFPGLNSVQSEYSLSSAGHSVYSAGAAWMPHFFKVKEGFSVNVMKPRGDIKRGSPNNVATDLFSVKATLDREHLKQQQSDDGASQESLTDNTSKTTAIVQLSGSVDVLVTPLLLEALQRCVEAVTPTLSRLHPSALIDGLHSQCLDRLKQQNKLKKGKEWEGNKEEGSYDNLSSCKEVTPVKTSSLQALFTLPKINICVLQASIVEEVIAFSNLGSASDLTAVSLLAVCIDGVKCQLLSSKHSCKVAAEASKEPLTRKTSATPNMVKFISSVQSRGKSEMTLQEPEIENPQEVSREENVGTLHISHVHVQLRRLLKFSNFSEHVLLTAIPEHSSRVLFTLEQDTSTPLSTLPYGIGTATASATINTNSSAPEGYIGTNIGVTPSPKRRLSRTSSRDREREREKDTGDGASLSSTLGRGATDTTPSLSSPYPQVSHAAPAPPTLSVPSIGFIMCECGLEDVSVTALRRLGFQDTSQEAQEVEEKLEGLDQTISQMEDSARTKVEEQISKENAEKQDTTKNKASAAKQNDEENKDHKVEREEPYTGNPTVLISPSDNIQSQSPSSESGPEQSSKDSSWASDHSAVSSDTPVVSAVHPGTLPEPLEGDASNGRLELKTIWFYFASPPPISIHKKVDYTRLDWNLLSTATPAIDAWLNPSDRLMTSVRSLVREYSRRLCCVVACMMIEGLESQGIHVAYKSKFNKLTPLSKTLQEDPSNQLLTVLRKYLHKHGTDQVERAVSVETVPQLITVQKGILALMRQWKNVLYMPNLSQVNFKSRRSIRPYNVKFALPKEENTLEARVNEEQEEVVVDQFDVVDERISLLQAEGGITQRSGSVPSIGSKRLSVSTQGKTADGDYVSAESFSVSAKPRKLSSIFRSKLKGAGGVSDSPLDHSSSNLAPPPQASGLLLSRNDSNISFTSISSSSNEQEILAVPTPPHTPLRHPGPKQSILKNKYRQNEDLYQWMAKQQTEKEHFPMDLHDDDEASRYIRQNTSESCAAAAGHLGSAWSQDDSKLDLNDGGDYTMATSIMQLADAQILFKPVLQSLGLHVESVRPSAMMKKFGGHLLLQGHITTFKILIAESEARPGEGGHYASQYSSKGKGRGKRSFNNRSLAESAAFQCERFDVNVSLEDVVDFGEDGHASKFPYKFAMHKLEAKPTTLQINLLVNCQAIRQNVDMALLRLAHQVLTMVGNVKETRVELKQKRMEPASGWVQTHRKQDSKDSTSSVETNHSDTSHTERLMGSFTNILALEKEREMMLGNTKSGSHTPLSTQPSQETTQQYTTSQQLQKSLAHALDSQLNSGGTLRPQVSGLGVRPIQPQPQYQPSPAAVMIGLAPGVRPVPSPMAASAKRMAVISQVAGEINDGKVKTSQESNNARAEAKVVHSADRKGDKTTRVGGTRAGSPILPATTVSSVRPEILPIVDVVQTKKPGQLRFAKDLKEEHAQVSTSKVSTPHPSAAHGITSTAAVNSSDIMTPPHSLNLSDCTVVLDMADTSSPALNQKTIIDEIKESTPQCWRHLYQLLELYATMPELKTVTVPVTQAVSKLPVIEEEDPDQEGFGKRESRVSDYGSKLTTLIQNRKSSMLHSLRRDSSSDGHELMEEIADKATGNQPQRSKVDVSAKEEETLGNNSLAHQSFIRTRFKQSIYVGESIPLIVYGILKVDKVLISAELSGLKLEANTTKVHASGTYKKKVKGFLHRVSSDSSYTAHVGHSMINLREGEPPDWQTVVTININKSQGLLTSVMRRGKEHNSTLVTVGVIDIDIPQHPVVLHDMMSRSSKRITATLQELRWPAQSNKMHFSSEDNSNQSASNIAASSAAAESNAASNSGASNAPSHTKGHHASKTMPSSSNNNAGGVWRPMGEEKVIRKHLHIKAVLQGIKVGASILPSLKAQYKTDAIKLTGVLGKRAHFTVTLPTHMLSFKSRITAAAALAETPIPSGASIELPPIQIIADYRVQKPGSAAGATLSHRDDHNEVDIGEELELLQGNYLYAVAEVGMLEHSLTTDLLNHLVFVQKVFMKEINEIVQKVSGAGPIDEVKPGKEDFVGPGSKPLLYSVSVRFKGIQVTATTPTSNAVRFETGAITLDLSNRFHLPKKDAGAKNASTEEEDKYSSSQKMFIQAVVDLNLALGQLLKNPVFEEAEPEFHTMAFFKTTIKVRNALQHEMIPTLSHDQEALLINLSRPIILAQPLAFDKAVLVWLNYKNAYEYWTEQRMALNKEVLHATRQVIDKLPHMAPATSPTISTLFLQLTVDDMGICVPLLSSPYQPMPAPAPGFQSPRVAEAEQGSALVLTVESTQISACSSGSLVSKGKFKNFCLRFADDFGSSWDDWKPWPSDSGAVMNQCNVPAGTYEVCSRTINKQDTCGKNAKWILNVQWEMKGIDVHLDTDIGKRFTLLGHTLTLLAGEGEEELMGGDIDTDGLLNGLGRDGKDGVDGKDGEDEDDVLSSPDTQGNSLEDLQLLKRRTSLASDILPEEIFLDTFDPKERARKIEREMNEQAKIVQELKECGATEGTIEIERKKLEDLQSLLFQDFRRDFMEKLKRQGDRANIIKDKLGIGTRPASHLRSKSIGTNRISGAFLSRHRSIDASAGDRRQSEDLYRMPKVSFSGHQLSTYTPPGSPDLHTYAESESERDDDETFTYTHQRSRSLEAIPSSGSDSQLDESLPYRRKKTASEDSGSVTSRDQAMKLGEQNVDFELDVKVFIDSGKCVLYPKEAKEEEVRKYAKKEKLVPGEAASNNGAVGSSSPPSKRKLKKEVSGSSISNRRKLSTNPDTTIFFVPSVAVKIHYNSKTDHMGYSASPGSTIVEEPDTFTGFHSSDKYAAAMSTPTNRHFSNIPEISVNNQPQGRGGMDADTSAGSIGGGPLNADFYGSPRRSGPGKKASLYAWFTLQTLPEEMIISPTLLDFLEQALEPLPVNQGSSLLKKDMMLMDSLVNNMDLDASQVSLGQQSMAFFPVDVVVHIKMDPTFIRFNCHPVSRVECLLQVPSLDLFFSTKKSDVNDSMLADISQTPRSSDSHTSRPGTRQTPTSTSAHGAGGSGYSRARHTSGISDTSTSTAATNHPGSSSSSGGLSVTGCMSDFSLYIFHPYGTGVQRRLAGHGDPSYKAQPGLERIAENATNAIHDLGRRDSLSLNVEYIRVNISRTRKLETHSEPGGEAGAGGAVKGEQQIRCNAVRFSAICDIGTASFKYDMRRLSEILSLPKAWYRRTLARRLFLGDDSMNINPGDECEPDTPEKSGRPVFMSHNSVSHPTLNEIAPPPTPLRKHHRRGSSGDKIRIQLSPEFKTEIASRRGHVISTSSHSQAASTVTSGASGVHFARDTLPSSSTSVHRKRSRTLASPDMPRHRHSVSGGIGGGSGQAATSVPVTATLSTSWETLVLFAVNLSQLNLEVNMANVMGNTEWHLNGIKTQGRLSINSSGHKNLNIDAGFGKTSLESKGGIVGGTIDINNLQGFFSVCEDPMLGQDPDHQAGLSTSALEMKLDYMGSSIIMTRLSHLQLSLKDEWHVDTDSQSDAPLATNRSAFLFVNGKLSWSHLHLMISRSTTPDLIKIVSKLDEFFSQQVMSSRRVFQAGPYPLPASAAKVPRKTSESAILNELRHHRHWQAALGHLLGHQFSMLPSNLLPQQGMVLGGTMALQGQGLMLASFHGVNFRAKYWALFNIKDPYIYFSTEAQKIPSGGTHIVEDLQFIVGQQQGTSREPTGVTSPQALHNHQATICKISRTQHMPPNFTSVDEWFTYAMTSSVTDPKVVTEFPGVRTEEDLGRKFSKVKATYYSHETEVIFAFPSLYMDLKTSHFQGETMPEETDERPVVECSFVAEFYDHIYVAMNAEVILFLHDLVSSYIREKDKSSGPRMSSSKASKTDSSKLSDPTTALKADFRTFQCKTWQLEPTIRLIHWASTQIDPVGADYVLQKLGFSHARVTIPKWVQRGFMDPLDKVLSVLVDKLITLLRDQAGGSALDESPDQEGATS